MTSPILKAYDINSFNPHSIMRQGNGGTVKLTNLPMVTQIIMEGAKIWIQELWLYSSCS